MAQFSVKSNLARIQADEEQQLIRELERLEDSLQSVSNNLRFKVAAKSNIRSRLNNSTKRIGAHARGMSSMHSALVEVLDDYERTERRIVRDARVEAIEIENVFGNYIAENFEQKVLDNFINPLLDTIDNGEYQDYILKRLESIKEFIAKTYEGDFSQLGVLLTIPELIKGDIDAFNNFIDNIKETIEDKTSFDIKNKVEDAFYKYEIDAENGSLGVSVSAYDAYANAEGGLFSLSDDGNLVFNPHIDAEMGASYTVFSGHGDYSVGDEMLGANAEGAIVIGQVAATTAFSAGMLDENGNFDPNVNFKASAEAILVDASAQAGVTVLGTEAKVKGSVNVGVGAHANIEVGDGKISFDVGASLGIGASISVSIDYGGTIDAIQKSCKSIWDKITPW